MARHDPTPAPFAMAMDDMICFNLYAASHGFTRFYQPLLEPLGLTYPQYLVMLSLMQRDGQGVGALSEELALDTNTLSPLLKRMETAGLIRRQRQSEDERRVSVHLTAAGRKVGASAVRVPDCILGCLDFSIAELDACSKTLRRLRKAMATTAPPVEQLRMIGENL